MLHYLSFLNSYNLWEVFMNKRFIKFVSILLIIFLSLTLFPNCYGKFQLTRKLYVWNGSLGNKWVNTAVMWIFFILPVYEVVGFIDFVILNVIEFWTGKNPLAMNPGEKETQLVEWQGDTYEITATQNRFDIRQLKGDTKISLVFNNEEKAWFVQSADGKLVKIAEFSQNSQNILSLIQPDGQKLKVNLKGNNLIL